MSTDDICLHSIPHSDLFVMEVQQQETWKLSSPSRVSSKKMSRLFPTTVYYVLKPPTWVLDAIHYHLYLMYGNKLHNSPLRFTQPKSISIFMINDLIAFDSFVFRLMIPVAKY